MKLFDANASVGVSTTSARTKHYTAQDLLADMDHFGIERALVYHDLSKSYDPAVGNERLMETIRGHDRLLPCWALLPHHSGDMKEPRSLVRELRERDVRAVRLYPKTHSFSLAEWCCGELLGELEQARLPLLLESDEANLDEVASLAAAHPNLPVVLCSISYRLDRCIYPLFQKHRNLHLELSWYSVHRGIETFCVKLGAEQLLFGTRIPTFTPGAAVTHLSYAEISEQQREMIASGNLRKLLGIQ